MFDFGLPLDITPVSSPPHFQEYRDKGSTPLSGGELFPTATVLAREPRLGHFKVEPATLTESEILREQQSLTTGVPEASRLDKARDLRITLLIEKYEGAATSEDSARLDILTQRLRRLSPRSTPKDFEILSAMVDEIEQVSNDLNELKNKYRE